MMKKKLLHIALPKEQTMFHNKRKQIPDKFHLKQKALLVNAIDIVNHLATSSILSPQVCQPSYPISDHLCTPVFLPSSKVLFFHNAPIYSEIAKPLALIMCFIFPVLRPHGGA